MVARWDGSWRTNSITCSRTNGSMWDPAWASRRSAPKTCLTRVLLLRKPLSQSSGIRVPASSRNSPPPAKKTPAGRVANEFTLAPSHGCMLTRLSAVGLILGLSYARAGPIPFSEHKVGVYLQTGSSNGSGALSYMKEELEGLLQTAGFSVEWKP